LDVDSKTQELVLDLDMPPDPSPAKVPPAVDEAWERELAFFAQIRADRAALVEKFRAQSERRKKGLANIEKKIAFVNSKEGLVNLLSFNRRVSPEALAPELQTELRGETEAVLERLYTAYRAWQARLPADFGVPRGTRFQPVMTDYTMLGHHLKYKGMGISLSHLKELMLAVLKDKRAVIQKQGMVAQREFRFRSKELDDRAERGVAAFRRGETPEE
jgi:hypothetical protein